MPPTTIPGNPFVSFTKIWHNSEYSAISPSRPELSAAGRNVVVTGGGTGIGKAIAIAFARAGAASIAIIGRREDRLQSSVIEIAAASTNQTTQVIYEVADLCKKSEVDEAFQRISQKVGRLSILVSNAGIAPFKEVLKTDLSFFAKSFEMLVGTALNSVQAFVPLAVPDAAIINISSGIAHISPSLGMPGMAVYAASKAAAVKLFEFLAKENPELHVVNVQPGVVATEIGDGPGDGKGMDQANLPGAFAVWLVSPEAAFLKNKFVWANWDVDELKERAEEIKNSLLCTIILDGSPM